MSFQAHLTDFGAGISINDRQRPAAIADPYAMSALVHANIVRVLSQRNLTYRCQVGPLEQSDRAITSVRNIKSICRCHIADSLWLAQAGERAKLRAPLQVDHSNTVVTELRHKQSLTAHIHRKVIDTPPDLTQGDLGLDLDGG